MNLLLPKKALILSYFTVFYNIFEGIFSIFIGFFSGSIALVGFGLDSFIESLSGGVMIWKLSKHEKLSEAENEKKERKAVKLIAYTFFILGVYILYESLKKLYLKEVSTPSIYGLIIPIASIIIMIALFYAKQNIGKAMGSRSLILDSKQTLACIFLSISLLIGLTLNYLFGLWWSDPVVGVIIAFFLFREGYEALEEERLCGC